MPPAERPIPLTHAIALGLLQGPAELLPVSSSAHITLMPRLLRWPYASLDGAQRKSFELAVHAGAGVALAAFGGALRAGGRPGAAVLAAAVGPPALAGVVLRGVVERRLGGPRQLAFGLAAGAAAMALAERAGGSAASGTRARETASRSGWLRPPRSCRACRATARRSPRPARGASSVARLTRSRGTQGCRCCSAQAVQRPRG